MNLNKLFDLRFVIGIFFLVIGLLILVYSFFIEPESAQNTNRWSGFIFALFGVLMVALSLQKDADDELLEEEKKSKVKSQN